MFLNWSILLKNVDFRPFLLKNQKTNDEGIIKKVDNSLFIHIIDSEFYADSKNVVHFLRRPFNFLEMSIFRQKMTKIANLNHFFFMNKTLIIFFGKKNII